ncbi:nucleoside 2-deoxyribosyltransferase [Sphingomonas parapaucimobilis]|uniref:nucleoside 2-deoxyribosyltransferase n=1 Tax=Sphingomonas parapaucimobilis TaxID=28213 RepID=UPI00321B8810
MSEIAVSDLHRCYISAPAGLELGVLPDLLADRGVAWEWARKEQPGGIDASDAIRSADFVIVVLNGTTADYRATFETGLAVGLGKPILLVQIHSRPLPVDLRQAASVRTNLSNRDALALHLDMFLATPHSLGTTETSRRGAGDAVPPAPNRAGQRRTFDSDLERRAYEAVVRAGGSAVVQPQSAPDVRFRPDLLAWMGHIDAELLDPVVIEVRGNADKKRARQLEEQLLGFMHATRVRSAMVLTSSPPPFRDHQLSANVLWLTIDEFEELSMTGRLGDHVRQNRNRIMHGIR